MNTETKYRGPSNPHNDGIPGGTGQSVYSFLVLFRKYKLNKYLLLLNLSNIFC